MKKIVVIGTGRMGGAFATAFAKKNVARGFDPRIACGSFWKRLCGTVACAGLGVEKPYVPLRSKKWNYVCGSILILGLAVAGHSQTCDTGDYPGSTPHRDGIGCNCIQSISF